MDYGETMLGLDTEFEQGFRGLGGGLRVAAQIGGKCTLGQRGSWKRDDARLVQMTIRGLVFDLAGVLLDFRGPESVHALSQGRTTEEEFFRFWSEAKCAHDFTCGKCTPEQFAWHKFLAEFRTWLRGPYDGALDLLQGLRPRYRVACLTGFGDLMIQLNEIKISS